jgi:uncharacterized protein
LGAAAKTPPPDNAVQSTERERCQLRAKMTSTSTPNRDGLVQSAFELGRTAFNRGDFFLAHELWEDVWRGLGGADKAFLQGLIQIAAGCHHLQKSRQAPGARLIEKGLEKLVDPHPNFVIGTPLQVLKDDAARLLAALATPGTWTPDPTILRL